MNLIIDDTDQSTTIKVASIQTAIQVYFIDNDDYFKQADRWNTAKTVKTMLIMAKELFSLAWSPRNRQMKLRWSTDIIHCQGWMSAVVPLISRYSSS